MDHPMLTIVVPCYNEEEILPDTMLQLSIYLQELVKERLVSSNSKILFVDDGSKDQTWEIIYRKSLEDELIKGLKLSRNVGHQKALLAGLMAAKTVSDCVISIDADLQDDISVIREFILKYREGYEIIYGVRRKRDTDTYFKRSTAQGFYKLMKRMGVDLVYNHADFRLMSNRALYELQRYDEVNIFLRGIVPILGLKSTSVYYDRKERSAGETKYPLKKMIAFSLEGLTSFSVTPIRVVMLVGFLSFFISLLFGVYFLSLKLSGKTETGWTSLITSIWLIGGIQLISIGVVGEYIGKIYSETKRRPKYMVDIDTFNLPIPRSLINDGENEHELFDHNYGKLSETN
ncbi:glycosyltransferase family 2 protein [Bacillus sp. JJ1474]|uniref:glycosyltransferase family 2 protein n=1 Tax=Bacillus sp. JJ1474 TaxID=3122955 RepID=UPI002FFE0C81